MEPILGRADVATSIPIGHEVVESSLNAGLGASRSLASLPASLPSGECSPPGPSTSAWGMSTSPAMTCRCTPRPSATARWWKPSAQTRWSSVAWSPPQDRPLHGLQGHVRLRRPLRRALWRGLFFVEARRPFPGSCQRPHLLGPLPRRVCGGGLLGLQRCRGAPVWRRRFQPRHQLAPYDRPPAGRPTTAGRCGQPQPGSARVHARCPRPAGIERQGGLRPQRRPGRERPPARVCASGLAGRQRYGHGQGQPGKPDHRQRGLPEGALVWELNYRGSSGSSTRQSARQ